MTLLNDELICTPCSVELNKPYAIAMKKFNVKKHSASDLHVQNAVKHVGKVFTGSVDGNLPAMVEELQLRAMNATKQQMAVLVHLLLRKRPVIEYVFICLNVFVLLA